MRAPAVTVVRATSTEDVPRMRELLLEYAATLDVDLCFQDFDREVAELRVAPPAERPG